MSSKDTSDERAHGEADPHELIEQVLAERQLIVASNR